MNSSERTRKELDLLRSYKARRVGATLLQIRREIDWPHVPFGGRLFSEYLADEHRATATVLRTAYDGLAPIVMSLKEEFDRVRPHKLSADIEAAIDCPRHPAYPSGHSSQAHLAAYLLSQILPVERNRLERQALAIAVRREIAGVHYPSDTAAGAHVARQYASLLLAQPSFQDLVRGARDEWR